MPGASSEWSLQVVSNPDRLRGKEKQEHKHTTLTGSRELHWESIWGLEGTALCVCQTDAGSVVMGPARPGILMTVSNAAVRYADTSAGPLETQPQWLLLNPPASCLLGSWAHRHFSPRVGPESKRPEGKCQHPPPNEIQSLALAMY